jgi:hypothetical protein
MTWADFGYAKGFHVFDPVTNDVEFIENTSSLLSKIVYDDKDQEDYWSKINLAGIENTYVKVVVVNKTDVKTFDRMMSVINKLPLLDLKVIEDLNDDIDDSEVSAELAADTKTLIASVISNSEFSVDKEILKGRMTQRYIESLEKMD